MTAESPNPHLFNTPLEAGVRVVVILEAFAPKAFDLATLSLLDYYLVHTADAGGPPSIHPDIDARAGEYFVRRNLVEAGALLMTRADVLERVADTNGLSYRSRVKAAAMIDMMVSGYNRRLYEAAEWLSKQVEEQGPTEFFAILKRGVDGHLHEISGQPGS